MAGKSVVLEKVESESDDPFATFTEWASEADERAFKSL
jgi:heme-degrading monooxygenase HmoA